MLTLGSALVAVTILTTALAALFFRRPDPPRWTRPDLVPMLVAVPLAAIMALGFGYMGVALYHLSGDEAVEHVVPALAVWTVAAALWRWLDVRSRLRAYAAADQAQVVAHPALAAVTCATRGAEPPAADPSHRHAA